MTPLAITTRVGSRSSERKRTSSPPSCRRPSGLAVEMRVTGDRTERARKAVAMRIGTALKAIETVHPELARHLRNSVSTGRFCSYRPDQELTWQLTATT